MSTQFTLYIYIKVLLVFSGHIRRHTRVSTSVRDLGVFDLHDATVSRDRNMVVCQQRLNHTNKSVCMTLSWINVNDRKSSVDFCFYNGLIEYILHKFDIYL